MKDRVFYIRKTIYNLSRAKFGEPIGMTDSEIKNVETGKTILKDTKIPLICKHYGINEEWLRTGKGKPNTAVKKNEQIQNLLVSVMSVSEKSSDVDKLKRQIIDIMANLSPEAWQALTTVAKEIKEIKKEQGK